MQADNYYEQCTNCTAESFERECAGWSKEIRAAAEAKCGLNCTAAAGDDDDGAAALETEDKILASIQQQQRRKSLDKAEHGATA